MNAFLACFLFSFHWGMKERSLEAFQGAMVLRDIEFPVEVMVLLEQMFGEANDALHLGWDELSLFHITRAKWQR